MAAWISPLMGLCCVAAGGGGGTGMPRLRRRLEGAVRGAMASAMLMAPAIGATVVVCMDERRLDSSAADSPGRIPTPSCVSRLGKAPDMLWRLLEG